MSTVTVEHQSAEPGKRVIRSALSWVIASATALPVILGAIVLPKGTELAAVVTDVVAVSTGITGLMAIPKVNAALSKIGLGATTVTKIRTATLAASDPITPAIEAAITAAKNAQAAAAAQNLSQAVADTGEGAAALADTAQAEVPLAESAIAAVS